MMWSPPEPEDVDPLEELTAAAIQQRLSTKTTGWPDWVKVQTQNTLNNIEQNSQLDDDEHCCGDMCCGPDMCSNSHHDVYGEDENNPEDHENDVDINGWT